MGKIFVRERNRVGRGAGMPRFAIVAVSGSDLRVFAMHIRRAELEKLAEEAGLDIIYLPRGEKASEDEKMEQGGERQSGHGLGPGRGKGGGRAMRGHGRNRAVDQD